MKIAKATGARDSTFDSGLGTGFNTGTVTALAPFTWGGAAAVIVGGTSDLVSLGNTFINNLARITTAGAWVPDARPRGVGFGLTGRRTGTYAGPTRTSRAPPEGPPA